MRRPQYSLGFCYQLGKGVAIDLKKAVELYTLSAEQNYAPAQYSLGFCYQLGKGVAIDLKKAVELYTLAAEQKYAQAQCNLGRLLYDTGKVLR